jgi:hypothetical protein
MVSNKIKELVEKLETEKKQIYYFTNAYIKLGTLYFIEKRSCFVCHPDNEAQLLKDIPGIKPLKERKTHASLSV